MRRLFKFLLLPLTMAAFLIVPSPVAATGGFYYTVNTDRCAAPYGWTSVLKVTESVYDWTTANRLTIDSRAEQRDNNTGHWYVLHRWAQSANSYTPSGSEHFLTLKRSYGTGDIEHAGRIVFTLRAWHNGNLLWKHVVQGRLC